MEGVTETPAAWPPEGLWRYHPGSARLAEATAGGSRWHRAVFPEGPSGCLKALVLMGHL